MAPLHEAVSSEGSSSEAESNPEEDQRRASFVLAKSGKSGGFPQRKARSRAESVHIKRQDQAELREEERNVRHLVRLNRILQYNRLEDPDKKSDGCGLHCFNLFLYLWAITEQRKACPSVVLPETILITNGLPAHWFFMDKHGQLKRKNSSRMNNRRGIFKCFSKETRVVADSSKRFVKAAHLQPTETDFGAEHTLLDDDALLDMLEGDTLPNGILQKFLPQNMGALCVIVHVTWYPTFMYVTRTQSEVKLDPTTGTGILNGETAGAQTKMDTSQVSKLLYKRLQKICEDIVAHVKLISPQTYDINCMRLHFKHDINGILHLLYCSCIRVEGSHYSVQIRRMDGKGKLFKKAVKKVQKDKDKKVRSKKRQERDLSELQSLKEEAIEEGEEVFSDDDSDADSGETKDGAEMSKEEKLVKQLRERDKIQTTALADMYRSRAASVVAIDDPALFTVPDPVAPARSRGAASSSEDRTPPAALTPPEGLPPDLLEPASDPLHTTDSTSSSGMPEYRLGPGGAASTYFQSKQAAVTGHFHYGAPHGPPQHSQWADGGGSVEGAERVAGGLSDRARRMQRTSIATALSMLAWKEKKKKYSNPNNSRFVGLGPTDAGKYRFTSPTAMQKLERFKENVHNGRHQSARMRKSREFCTHSPLRAEMSAPEVLQVQQSLEGSFKDGAAATAGVTCPAITFVGTPVLMSNPPATAPPRPARTPSARAASRSPSDSLRPFTAAGVREEPSANFRTPQPGPASPRAASARLGTHTSASPSHSLPHVRSSPDVGPSRAEGAAGRRALPPSLPPRPTSVAEIDFIRTSQDAATAHGYRPRLTDVQAPFPKYPESASPSPYPDMFPGYDVKPKPARVSSAGGQRSPEVVEIQQMTAEASQQRLQKASGSHTIEFNHPPTRAKLEAPKSPNMYEIIAAQMMQDYLTETGSAPPATLGAEHKIESSEPGDLARNEMEQESSTASMKKVGFTL